MEEVNDPKIQQTDFNSEFTKMLADSDKRNWIEVKMIQELKTVNGSQKFDDIFKDALSACDKRRNNPDYYGKTITISESNPLFLELLAKECARISYFCCHMLYELQHQQIALNIIQHLIKLETQYAPQYKIFFTRINQIFYHSRRLLAVTMAPEIIKQYINDNSGQEIAFQIVAFKDESNTDLPNHHICRFKVNNGEYICEFLRKHQGVFFGSIVKIKTKDGNLLKRYYLKAYEGYPAVNQKNSQQSYADTTILYILLPIHKTDLQQLLTS